MVRSSTHQPTPRRLAKAVTALASLGLVASLAACAPNDEPEIEIAEIDFQLSWTHSVEWAATYLAEENGYFADESVSVNLLPGGPNVAAAPVVVSGGATVGNSTANSVASAAAEGADLVILGAEYQLSPWAIISPAEAPIETPADLLGKRVLVAASSEPAWNAFLALNDLDPTSITTIPGGFDYTPIATGEADAVLGYWSTGPGDMENVGVEPYAMLFSDWGFDVVSHSYFVTRQTLEAERDALKRFLTATIRGVRDYLVDVETPARIAVEEYGSDLGLDLETQLVVGERQLALITTEETEEHGLLYLTPETVERILASFEAMGISSADESLFDMSILDEIYAENPELLELP